MWCQDRTGRRFPPLPGSDSVQVPPHTLGGQKVPFEEEGVLQTRQPLGLEEESQFRDIPSHHWTRSGAHNNNNTIHVFGYWEKKHLKNIIHFISMMRKASFCTVNIDLIRRFNFNIKYLKKRYQIFIILEKRKRKEKKIKKKITLFNNNLRKIF